MSTSRRINTVVLAGLSLAMLAFAGASSAQSVKVTLSGGEEVPPVTTSASGGGIINIGNDKSVSGGVTIKGLDATAAHIHQGARGKNGPVSVGLVKSGDNVWSVPVGAKLTDAQYDAFKAGELYVNVHTAANKGGEIRGQLTP